MFWYKKKTEEDKNQDNEQIDIQAKAEEEETVSGQTEKKKYLYMVVDKNKNVLFGRKGNPLFCTVDEGSAPNWPIRWPRDIVRKAQLDTELRLELKGVPENLSKDDKKKARQRIKEEAREQLLKLGAERIAAAKERQNPLKHNENNSVQVIYPKIQETPKEKPVEQTDSVKPEAASVPEETAAEVHAVSDKKDAVALEKPETEEFNQDAPANKDLSVITSCIERNAKELSVDLTTNVDDLIEVINNNGNENTRAIKSCVEPHLKRIYDTTMSTARDVANITQKTQKYAENIVSRVNENGRSISESQEELISKVSTVGKRVTELGESVEGIEGNLHRLDQLDGIIKLLRDKGLTISRDIPPVNADEEDIINLVRYSQKITEQLGYAARDYIRKQEAFKRQEENNANEQRMMEQKIAKAHAEGVEEGKKAFIKQMLSKYEDVDTIRESDNNYVHAIWTLLIELGVSIDGEGYYEKGKEIELAASDIEKMIGTYSKLEDAGKYRVVRTGLCFQGEILCKAAFDKVTETTEPKTPKAEENPETGKEEGEPEATSEETK